MAYEIITAAWYGQAYAVMPRHTRLTRSEFDWSEGAMATIQVIQNEKCALCFFKF